MRLPFKELSDDDGPYLRPVLQVDIGGHDLRLGCLVDTGALHNRFGRWVAEVLGVDLDAGERARIALGGVITDAVTVPIPLALGDWAWSAPVSFCEPWPFDFQILGQEGFLRFFQVLLVASEHRMDVHLDLGPPLR